MPESYSGYPNYDRKILTRQSKKDLSSSDTYALMHNLQT